jgi:hypothetical protein
MTAPARSSYPASLALDAPLEVARWRPLVAWLLAIPQILIARVLGYVAGVTALISWFAILFTGKDLEGLQGFRCMAIRAEQRAWLCAGFVYEPYPPFSYPATGADPGDLGPLRVDLAPQLEDRNRATVAFRVILVLPHVVVLALLGIAALVCYVIAGFAVIITGRWPEGLRRFVVGVARWVVRLEAYFMLLVDDYPPFSLD